MKNSDQRQPFTEGDQQIFQELYQKHHRLVYAIVLLSNYDRRVRHQFFFFQLF